MKLLLSLLLFCAAAGVSVQAQDNQGKGVDNQTGRIRDTGSDRQPGKNGSNQSTGTGRGIDFGKDRRPCPIPFASPPGATPCCAPSRS